MDGGTTRTAEGADAVARIADLVARCPDRTAGSASERRAQEALGADLAAAGLTLTWAPFRGPGHLYLYMAVEFGLAVLGSALLPVAPALALALHLWVAVSWFGHASRRFTLTSRFLPHRDSQNLLATLPAVGPVRRRLVLLAHADAAYTGLMFDPRLVRIGTRGPFRQVAMAWTSVALLVGVDAAALLVGHPALLALGAVLTVPSLLVTLGNLDVVLRNRIVPGASDDLSGCAAAVMLARRLARTKPEDVELVVAITGAEEAGTRGANALARDATWEHDRTFVLAIDGVGHGVPVLLQEGEVLPIAWPPRLGPMAERVAASEERFAAFRRGLIPAGATDALPFRARGYDALALICTDPYIGAPRNYHLPGDTPDTIEPDVLLRCVDYAEALAAAVFRG